MNLAVRVRHGGRTKFARVKVPGMLPRFVPLPDKLAPRGGTTFAFLEDVIRANIGELFPGTQVESAHLFRVIRDTDMVIQEDEADDLLETVDRGLKQLRYGALSLLQVEADMPRARAAHAGRELRGRRGRRGAHRRADSASATGWQLTQLPRPAPEGPAVPPAHAVAARRGRAASSTRSRDQDLLVHHPFESFAPVETFLRAAVARPAGRRHQDDALPDRRRTRR